MLARSRRLRKNESIRSIFRETHLNKDDLFSYEEKQKFFSSKENSNIKTDIRIKNEVNFSILL